MGDTYRALLRLEMHVGGVTGDAVGDTEVDQLEITPHKHEVSRFEITWNKCGK
jgi:hypothetical protein